MPGSVKSWLLIGFRLQMVWIALYQWALILIPGVRADNGYGSPPTPAGIGLKIAAGIALVCAVLMTGWCFLIAASEWPSDGNWLGTR
ncbi:MAG: hypothetical protein LBI31_02010 [Zoogloeaceae bacterium]|nr:hypothetical protein [Zoogloeaceae bacterium]